MSARCPKEALLMTPEDRLGESMRRRRFLRGLGGLAGGLSAAYLVGCEGAAGAKPTQTATPYATQISVSASASDPVVAATSTPVSRPSPDPAAETPDFSELYNSMRGQLVNQENWEDIKPMFDYFAQHAVGRTLDELNIDVRFTHGTNALGYTTYTGFTNGMADVVVTLYENDFDTLFAIAKREISAGIWASENTASFGVTGNSAPRYDAGGLIVSLNSYFELVASQGSAYAREVFAEAGIPRPSLKNTPDVLDALEQFDSGIEQYPYGSPHNAQYVLSAILAPWEFARQQKNITESGWQSLISSKANYIRLVRSVNNDPEPPDIFHKLYDEQYRNNLWKIIRGVIDSRIVDDGVLGARAGLDYGGEALRP